MASIYASLLEQKKAFTLEKSSTPIGLVLGLVGGGWKLQMPHSGARWFTPKPYVGTEKKSATAPPQDNTKIALSSKSAENAIFIGNLQ